MPPSSSGSKCKTSKEPVEAGCKLLNWKFRQTWGSCKTPDIGMPLVMIRDHECGDHNRVSSIMWFQWKPQGRSVNVLASIESTFGDHWLLQEAQTFQSALWVVTLCKSEKTWLFGGPYHLHANWACCLLQLLAYLDYSSTIKLEEIFSSEMSDGIRITRRYNPGHLTLYGHQHEIHKFNTVYLN
jgi:hypothetical protein